MRTYGTIVALAVAVSVLINAAWFAARLYRISRDPTVDSVCVSVSLKDLISRILLVAVIALVAAYVTLLLAGKGLEWLVWEDYKRFRSIKVGMSEAEVRGVLGEPRRVYEGKTAPADYYVKGYSFERRTISGRVLIYLGDEPIAYVYIDPTGKVEHIFVGGS